MSNNESDTASIEKLYLKEKKKTSILMVSTIALAILFIGSLAMRSDPSSTDSTATQNTQAGTQQRGPGGRGGQPISAFFDDSGSVDQEAVDEMASRFSQSGGTTGSDPSQFLERLTQQIEASVASGEITQAQADELQAALAQTESSEN